MFKDKTLLITGGTGSFGNAALRRLLQMDVGEIRIFSRDEKKQDDMRRQYQNSKIKFLLGDVRNYDSVSAAMSGVDYVFHAAALKQVPACEFFPLEAVRTNVLGTENTLAAAIANQVQKIVCLSTDKAVYPINAMGMSKALMEKAAVAKTRLRTQAGAVISVTRYGNVMCSRGSVIPLFISQIKNNQPLTITDPHMTRFMMTLDDAIDLVLFAFENAKGGEIFVQKAPACTLQDLAEVVSDLFGNEAGIRHIGTRHGEKLYESLLTREEMARAVEMERYYVLDLDDRDLNYGNYFAAGKQAISEAGDYTSHNTTRLLKSELKALLLSLSYVQNALHGMPAEDGY